jgi:hypothetical protein
MAESALRHYYRHLRIAQYRTLGRKTRYRYDNHQWEGSAARNHAKELLKNKYDLPTPSRFYKRRHPFSGEFTAT